MSNCVSVCTCVCVCVCVYLYVYATYQYDIFTLLFTCYQVGGQYADSTVDQLKQMLSMMPRPVSGVPAQSYPSSGSTPLLGIAPPGHMPAGPCQGPVRGPGMRMPMRFPG